VRILHEHGYRRIGFEISKITDERTDRNFSGGFLTAQREYTSGGDIPLLIVDARDIEEQRKQFNKWYKHHRPDAILALFEHACRFFKEERISYSECGLALLSLDESRDKTVARIDQNDVVIGKTAVDYVVGMIQRNERGVPSTPLRILVESVWIPGNSLPGRPVGEPAPPPARTSRPRKASGVAK